MLQSLLLVLTWFLTMELTQADILQDTNQAQFASILSRVDPTTNKTYYLIVGVDDRLYDMSIQVVGTTATQQTLQKQLLFFCSKPSDPITKNLVALCHQNHVVGTQPTGDTTVTTNHDVKNSDDWVKLKRVADINKQAAWILYVSKGDQCLKKGIRTEDPLELKDESADCLTYSASTANFVD
jgi:hypothetical protein